jgi:hypothetical protein
LIFEGAFMSDQLSPAEHRRCVALEAAGRCAEPGTATSGLLSRAFQCETYIVTGLIRTGPRWLTGTECGTERVSIIVEAPDLSVPEVEKIRAALAGVL